MENQLSDIRRLLMEFGWDSYVDARDWLRRKLEKGLVASNDMTNWARRAVQAEASVHVIATMLGWENDPPLETLESDIRALQSLTPGGSELRAAYESGWREAARQDETRVKTSEMQNAALLTALDIMRDHFLVESGATPKHRLETFETLTAKVMELEAKLDCIADATGIAGVDEPMGVEECVLALRRRAEQAEARLAAVMATVERIVSAGHVSEEDIEEIRKVTEEL